MFKRPMLVFCSEWSEAAHQSFIQKHDVIPYTALDTVTCDLNFSEAIISWMKWILLFQEKLAVKRKFVREDKPSIRIRAADVLKLKNDHVLRHLTYRLMTDNYGHCCLYTFMELCEGGTLREVLRYSRLTPVLLQKWCKQILIGLNYLHIRNMVHCDIKSANILLTSQDFDTCILKISDLELVTRLRKAPSPVDVEFVGTMGFMSPEMLLQGLINDDVSTDLLPAVTTKSDIWSFGRVCMEMMMRGLLPPLFRDVRSFSNNTFGFIRLTRYLISLQAEDRLELAVGAEVIKFLRPCSLPIVDMVLQCFMLNPQLRSDAGTLLKSKFFAVECKSLTWQEEPPTIQFTLCSTTPIAFGKLNTRVYAAIRTDTEEKHTIALKSVKLPQYSMERKQFKFVFERKALKLLKLKHENIVPYLNYSFKVPQLDFESNLPRYFIWMEYLQGGTLSQAVRNVSLSPQQMQRWAHQVLLGIEYLHEWRIIHRDIKGDNIFLSSKCPDTCVLKIGDLDDTKCLSCEEPGRELISAKGTPSYASAEMLRMLLTLVAEEQEFSIAKKTDIWSFGCVLIQLVTGLPPDYPNMDHELNPSFVQHVGEGHRPSMPSDMPVQMKDLVDLCLKIDTNRRPDASELLQHKFFEVICATH